MDRTADSLDTIARTCSVLRLRLLNRVVPEEDTPAQPFWLTAQGRRLIEKAVPAWEKAQRQATELLGEEGIVLLDRAATRLQRARTKGDRPRSFLPIIAYTKGRP